VKLYKENPPGNLYESNTENVVDNGRKKIENVSIPEIVVFKPLSQDSNKPAVVICPGGGFTSLSIFDGGYEIAQELNKHGIVAIVLKYRTYIDNFYKDYKKIPLNDLEKAFDIIKDSSVVWGINLNNTGVMGLSAGGHLASMKAVSNEGFKTAFNLLIYPVISFRDELTSAKTKSRSVLLGKQPTETEKNYYSAELRVDSKTNPCFIVHAQNDSTVLVQNSLMFYKALVENKIKSELIIFQKGGHGFASNNKEQNISWIPLAINWMKTNEFLKK
jgi:acetyl esterase/lipase